MLEAVWEALASKAGVELGVGNVRSEIAEVDVGVVVRLVSVPAAAELEQVSGEHKVARDFFPGSKGNSIVA